MSAIFNPHTCITKPLSLLVFPYSYIKPIPFGDTFFQKTMFNSNLHNLNLHISITFSLAKCFFRGLYLFILTPPPPIVAPSYPGIHDLNKLKSSQPEDAFTQICAFLSQWFLRRSFSKIFSTFQSKNSSPIVVST